MVEDVPVRYGVLGAVRVLGPGGVEVPVGGLRARALLVLLLLDAGRIVPAERLIDGLYGDSPPAGAANALQSQVSRLRQALGEYAPIEFHPAGYRLAVAPDLMPHWLGTAAAWNPLSATVAAIRDLFGNPGTGGDTWAAQHPLLLAIVWPVLLIAIFAPLAVRRYQRLSR